MAEAAAGFLLENLKQLLLYHADLIRGAKDEIVMLDEHLRFFRAFLKDAIKLERTENSFQEAIRQIRDVVYEAEDIIDRFLTKVAQTKTKSSLLPLFRRFNESADLHSIATDVKSVNAKFERIKGDKTNLDFSNLNDLRADGAANEKPENFQQAPQVREDNVVGFEDEAAKIIGYLNETSDQLDVISVVGMPGLGKTTLARKIFLDIKGKFSPRIWVYVSQEFNMRNVYLAILKEINNGITDEMRQKNDQELAELIREDLKNKKFFIVMDDVWKTDAWDKIRDALPKSNGYGKVLITSRHSPVAQHATTRETPHKLGVLTPEKSWLLLRHETFGKRKCPPILEELGEKIAKQCNGLPLAIVIIGGVLLSKITASSGNENTMKNSFDKVSKRLPAYIDEDPEKRMKVIIELSYNNLPYEMRACFLYLGMFPEDFEIPVWKLVSMWIAEGFVRPQVRLSLEETAENYLDEFINRNLVTVDKWRPDGRVKTCRIHDMLRDFCIRQAGSVENFLQEIQTSYDGFEKCRRICIHSNSVNFLSRTPLMDACARSFVCLSKEDLALPLESTSAFLAAFKLLRVLEVKSIKFQKIPSNMFDMVHLRFITLFIDSGILPADLALLWNIETLIVDTSCPTLKIEAKIWKMRQLKHLKTNASASLPAVSKSSKEGEKLQTLGTISPKSCTREVFARASNLKKLGIRGKLALLQQSKSSSFNNLTKLSSLETLKLENDVESRLSGLPPHYQFPPNLMNLTLSSTFLNWDHMSILALLPNLQVLKLKEKAFVGEHWVETGHGGFRCLEVLHIRHTNLTTWKTSFLPYPKLRHLELRDCKQLKEIPIQLADIPTFQILDLYNGNDDAITSASKIEEAKQGKPVGQNINFKLFIFPPPGPA